MTTSPFVSTEWLAAHANDADVAIIDASWYLPTMNRDELAALVLAEVARQCDAIAARPAVQRAIRQQEAVRAVTTQFDKAQADKVDRMMGRGKYALA